MKSFSRISHQFVSDDKYQMLERKINYAGNLHINYTVMARKGSGGIWDFILNLPMASASPKGSSFELLYVHSYIYVHCFFFSFFLAFALSFFFFLSFFCPFSFGRTAVMSGLQRSECHGQFLSLMCGGKGLESLLNQDKSLANSMV